PDELARGTERGDDLGRRRRQRDDARRPTGGRGLALAPTAQNQSDDDQGAAHVLSVARTGIVGAWLTPTSAGRSSTVATRSSSRSPKARWAACIVASVWASGAPSRSRSCIRSSPTSSRAASASNAKPS